MSTLVLCNVGLRDVQWKGAPIQPARTRGKALLENDAAVADELSFPIIEPALRYILDQLALTAPAAQIDRLILFGTDQPAGAAEHRDNDTLYCATLAATWLPALLAGRIGAAEAIWLTGINPALYDETYEAFDEQLARLPKHETDYFAVLSGGTPAANAALLLQGVRYFGERLRVVYTPQGGHAQELRAGAQIAGAFREAAAIKHLQRLDFDNAGPLLGEIDAQTGLRHLVTYAAQRYNFDFPAAQLSLEAARREGGHPLRRFLIENQPLLALDALLSPSSAAQQDPARILALLRELAWNAEITYAHRRYADFLGRVYRFQEAFLRYLIESLFQLPTDLNPTLRRQTQSKWEAGIRANPNLYTYLSAQNWQGRPLDWTNISRPVFQAMLKYALNDRSQDKDGAPILPKDRLQHYQAVSDRLNSLDKLVDLRHRTIIGHDFQGVSEQLLRREFKPHDKEHAPPDRMLTLLRMIGADMTNSPYRTIAEFTVVQLHSPT